VLLIQAADVEKAIDIIGSLPGLEAVLGIETAAARFRLMASRIGDLVVIPDIDTVFGDLPDETEALDASYQSHGSLYEMDVPLLFLKPEGKYPDSEELKVNLDLTRFLYRQVL